MISALLAALAFLGSIMIFSPVQEHIRQMTFLLAPNRIPTEADLIEMRWRNIIDRDTYIHTMRRHGFDADKAERIYTSSENLLTATELVSAKWRGIITPDEFYQHMEKRRFTKDLADKFVKISEFIPSPTDMIRFAVREVFTPAIVEKYKMDEDFPKEFVAWFEKVGGTEEMAKFFWRAHWELPSVTQGYEMLHRGIINMDDLKTLMRTLDINPFWRDKLIEISYLPFTRVDVRRMFRFGVLDYEEVIRPTEI